MLEKEIVAKYIAISGEIQNEIDENLLNNFTVGDNSDYESDQWQNHIIQIIRLRGERISLLYELLPEIREKYIDVITEDIDEIIKCVKQVEFKGEVDEEVISDAFDCILAVYDGCLTLSDYKRSILRYNSSLKVLEQEVQGDLWLLLLRIANLYVSIGDNSKASKVLSYFLTISEKRCKEDIYRYREIVVDVFSLSLEKHIEQLYNRCIREKKWFDGAIDKISESYIWLYASALNEMGRFNDARIAFGDCYRICYELYGNKTWFTSLARREYSALSLLLGIEKVDSLNFLISFVYTIEGNEYQEIEENIKRAIEGRTLYIILSEKLKSLDFSSFEIFLGLYSNLCKVFNLFVEEPLIKERLYYNFLGGYYIKKGNGILAEAAYISSLNSAYPDGAEEIMTRLKIKTNLLMAYHLENDLEKAFPLFFEIFEALEEGKKGLDKKDEFRVRVLYNGLIGQSLIELDENDIYDFKDKLYELKYNIEEDNILIEDYASEAVSYIITSLLILLENKVLTKKEKNDYLNLLIYIKNKNVIIGDSNKEVLLLLAISKLAYESDCYKAVEYIDEAIKRIEFIDVPFSVKIAVLQTKALVLFGTSEVDEAKSSIKASLDYLTDMWHSCICYCNDSRLLKILTPSQIQFVNCYSMMRYLDKDIKYHYEMVLKFKALASLAGKERNRYINLFLKDNELLREIQKLQNQIAVIETGYIFLEASDAQEYVSEKERLRVLEAEFARRFLIIQNYVPISLDKVLEKLPDNCALVEYFMFVDRYNPEQMNPGIIDYDVYIIRKFNGNIFFDKITIIDVRKTIAEVMEFLEIIQDQSAQLNNFTLMERKEKLRVSLFNKLVEPYIGLLSGIKDVFIAPDEEIINLPFDILGNRNGEMMGDEYTIIKVECGRDFLFGDEKKNEGSLVIGNPKFLVEDEKISSSGYDFEVNKERLARINSESINPLPFAEIEAEIVSRYCNSPFLIGEGANRKALLSGEAYGIVHIATHGYYDADEEKDTLYTSSLLFSGVVNWLKTGYTDSVYGNGVVTADEISRLNMHGVELVVVSACFGGMNDYVLAKSFHGLVGGFAAAGAKYVVANLWRVDDLAAAILMDEFYFQYRVNGLNPPSALKHAQRYLRKMTFGELKKRKIFILIMGKSLLDETVSQYIHKLISMDDDSFQPFKKEVYWAGFNCYRCN